jgi:non-homologous end joining protein Ku
LIAAKRKGKEIAAPEDEEEPDVINLMEALKNSLSSTRRRTPKSAPARKRKRKAV